MHGVWTETHVAPICFIRCLWVPICQYHFSRPDMLQACGFHAIDQHRPTPKHLEEGGDSCTSHGKQPLLQNGSRNVYRVYCQAVPAVNAVQALHPSCWTDEWPKALRNALPMLLSAPTASGLIPGELYSCHSCRMLRTPGPESSGWTV